MSRQAVINLAKVLLAVTLIVWVVQRAGPETILQTLRNLDTGWWTRGLLVMFVAFSVSILRWFVLMRSVGLDTSLWQAYRLGFIGVFFNNVVPGLTGGDLVKAVYVARDHPERRAHAVLTVIVDRVVGIVALALIGAVVILFDLNRFGQLAVGLYGFLLLAALGGGIALSRRAKARIRDVLAAGRPRDEPSPDGWRAKLRHVLRQIDDAVTIYRARPGMLVGALGMSVVVHLLIIIAVWTFAQAIAEGGRSALAAGTITAPGAPAFAHLGSLDLSVHCSLIPIAQIVAALPIAPAGWGVGEVAFVYCFGLVGVSEALATTLSLVFRMTQTLISLLGGLFLLGDRRRVMQASHSPV